MDKNHKIGFLLIILTLLVFSFLNKKPQALIEKEQKMRDSIELVKKQADEIAKQPQKSVFENLAKDSLLQTKVKETYGDIANALNGTEEKIVLENDDLKLTFSNKGGRIVEAELKKYKKSFSPDTKDEDKTPLLLMEDIKNRFEYLLKIGVDNTLLSTQDLYFTSQKNNNSIAFILNTVDGKKLEQIYTLNPKGFEVSYQVNTKGMGDKLTLNWVNYLDRIEPGKMYEKTYSSVYFKEIDQDVDYCKCNSNDEKNLQNKVSWISHSNQYFNTSLIAQPSNGFSNVKLATEMFENEAEDMKKLTSQLDIDITSGENKLKFFIGPNEYHQLAATGVKLEEIIPFGASIFGSLNRWIIRPSFDFLSSLISSKGWAIILFIFIIKMLLYPLLYKMLLSQAKMGALKPELTQIKEKHKDDLQKQQVETMKIYQEFGVSPFSGCMPMLLQMPIWIALYRFFPASITFRQEGFLWANDLSTFDPLFKLGFEIPFMGSHISLFTLLWAVSTLVYTYFSMKNIDMSANPAMKYVQYIMPLMFLGFFNNYASGLTCYMFFSNLINILQTIFTKAFIFDEAKIRTQLDLQKASPKKKTGFGAKMEELMKQQQAIQEQKRKQLKK